MHERLGFQQKLFFQRREVHRKRQVLYQDFVMERLREQGRKGRVLAAPQKVSRHLAQLRQKIRRKFGIGMSALVEHDAALPVGLRADFVLKLESPEPLQHDVGAPVRERLHADDASHAAGRKDRGRAVVVGFPSLLQQHHSDHPMRGRGIPHHRPIARLEDMQRKIGAGIKDEIRKRKQRDDAGNFDRVEIASGLCGWAHIHVQTIAERPSDCQLHRLDLSRFPPLKSWVPVLRSDSPAERKTLWA